MELLEGGDRRLVEVESLKERGVNIFKENHYIGHFWCNCH
jgi:hypothetical protein